MHKFFVDENCIYDNMARIQGEDVKHIYKVLRLEVGNEVIINNCLGKEFLAKIKDINKKEVILSIQEELNINNESNVNLYLFQGLPKASKMDLIVQKATELGVKEIVPIITERVIVKNEMGEFKKLDRWQRIALEACKQCKRTFIPEIKEPMEFETMIKHLNTMDLVIVPYENASGYGIKNVMKNISAQGILNIAIIIGPEGGFEEQEINKLKENDAHIVTLGPRIFRTETAGFVCTTLLQYELGDLGGII